MISCFIRNVATGVFLLWSSLFPDMREVITDEPEKWQVALEKEEDSEDEELKFWGIEVDEDTFVFCDNLSQDSNGVCSEYGYESDRESE